MFKKIEQALVQHYQRYANQTLFIAYSGGIDSQVLLHATAQLIKQKIIQNTLAVCHIHHGLSENADTWLAFAKEQSHIYAAQFYAKKVNLDVSQGESIEALARDARYQALTEMSNPHDVIITGHHNNDQAETLLLALKRGSGLAGLSAMSETTPFNDRLLIRPLLTLSKADIKAYAKHYQLHWVEDESNLDNTFDRNFLRNEVLPLLTKRWPSIATTMVRSAKHCDDAAQLIDEVSEADFNNCKRVVGKKKHREEVLCVECLLDLSELRFNYVVRYFFKLHHGLMPSQAQLLQLRDQLCSPNDKNPAIKVGQLWLRRYQAHLYLTKEFKNIDDWSVNITKNDFYQSSSVLIDLPDTLGKVVILKNVDDIDFKVNNFLANLESNMSQVASSYFTVFESSCLRLSFTHSNPMCLPEFRNKHRSVKKVLQELQLPPWQRKRQLFLFEEDNFIGAAGQFICKPYLQCSHTEDKTNMNKTKANYSVLWYE